MRVDADVLHRTIPLLQEVQATYRDQVQRDAAPYCFAVQAHAGDAEEALGLFVLDRPESIESEAHLGHLALFNAVTLEFAADPRPLRDRSDVDTALADLAFSTRDTQKLWDRLIKRVVQAVDKGRYPNSHHLITAAEAEPYKFMDAWERRKQLIEQRAEAGTVYRGGFALVPRERKSKPNIAEWECGWKNPLTARQEIHVMSRHYAWLLEEEQVIDYVISSPLTVRNNKDYIVVSPTDEDITHANEVYGEFDDYIDRVANGECMYGNFTTLHIKGRKEVVIAYLDVIEDSGTKRFLLHQPDMPKFDSTNRGRSANQQGCFFEVIRQISNKDDMERFVCKIVGPPPCDTPRFFKLAKMASPSYLGRSFSLNRNIEKIGNRATGELYRQKPSLTQ